MAAPSHWSSAIHDGTEAFPGQLGERVEEILSRLASACEALGDGQPYDSVSAFTPQGNLHVAFANGAVKEQGEQAHAIMAASSSVEDQLAAFEQSARSTLEAVAKAKPAGMDRLIWRVKPEAGRELRQDGLYIKIYTRLGWDRSESKE